jgi:hypothetical protein
MRDEDVFPVTNSRYQGAAILVRATGIIVCSLAVEIVLTTLAVASWAPASH